MPTTCFFTKPFARATAVALAAAALSVTAFAQSHGTPNKCRFYEHFNYEGKSFELHTGHVLTIDPKFVVGSDFTEGKDYKRFNAPEWTGIVSATKVAKNCKAVVVKAPRDAVWVQDVPSFDANWNDKAIAFGCRCQ